MPDALLLLWPTDMLEHYRAQYGDECEALFQAMLECDAKVALINPFITKESQEKLFSLGSREPNLGPFIITLPKDLKPFMIDGLLSHYFLDKSSCLAPLLLPVKEGQRVLDMCSAPGGKLLFMLSRLVPSVSFVANDISKARLTRLRQVIGSYVPKTFQDSYIKITNRDASFFGLKQKESFDAVLLDAPCGSEAHILRNPTLLARFRPQKSLAKRQYALLCAALLAVKKGGYIMYATCSINKNENEGVIQRLINKKGDQVSMVALKSPLGDSHEFGISVLPHRHGAGPAFISLLRKT